MFPWSQILLLLNRVQQVCQVELMLLSRNNAKKHLIRATMTWKQNGPYYQSVTLNKSFLMNSDEIFK